MASITVDLRQRIGTVDRAIFGGFIEHIGRCIYGGVFDEGSALSDSRGFRRDVLDALRPLRISVLRWPGGMFVNRYHWIDGVGSQDVRPRRMELVWHAEESNRFGTDEFIAYCRELGAEPLIVVNMGTGTIDEAQAWVEYCNGTGNTQWASLRRRHGHDEPYGVKYWGLGNETVMYGTWQGGSMSPEEYVSKARQFAAVMKWTDPSIRLVSCGQQGWNEWDKVVIDGLIDIVDYHGLQFFTGSPDYYTNVFHPHQAERALRICEALIERARYASRIERPVYVAFNEWNVWFRERRGGLEERYSLTDALAVATLLNIFIRHCRSVRMAHLTQLVNAMAPIVTDPSGIFLQTIYHAFRLYAEHTREVALDVWVDSETHAFGPGEEDLSVRPHRIANLSPFPLLDVSATCDAEESELTLGVVNRARGRPIAAAIRVAGRRLESPLQASELTHDDPDVLNSFEHPGAVAVHERRVEHDGADPVTYEFPPHSITVLRVSLRRPAVAFS